MTDLRRDRHLRHVHRSPACRTIALQIQHQGQDFRRDTTRTLTSRRSKPDLLAEDGYNGRNYQLMRYDGDCDRPADCGEHRRSCIRVFRRARRASPHQAIERHQRALDQLWPEATRTWLRPPRLGAGENCVFNLVGGKHVARATMPSLGTGPLVKLTRDDADRRTRGVRTPDASRYDADLLRVRTVK